MSSRTVRKLASGIVAAATALGISSFAFVSEAHALTTACSGYIAQSVTGYISAPNTTNTTCGIGSAVNDNATELNSDLLGGYSSWVFIAKLDQGTPGTAGALTIGGTGSPEYTGVGGTLTGTWSIAASLYSTYSVVALVFKDGNGIPASWIGYLTNLADSSGDFRSPYLNNSEPKDISHFSLYGVTGVNPIPLPAAFPLFATALGGMGLLGWLRRRKAAAA